MATIDEELKRMRGASPSAFTPFSQARGAEAIRGFGSGMAPKLSEPQSIFAGSAQQSSQDFSRLQMPQTPSIPLGNTIPAFPDNYNQAMTDRSRAPSAMVSGIRDTTSGFGIYGGQAQLGSGQTPSMAPATDAITSFGSPLASRTERITSPYGTASTTLNPEQQAQRFQASQGVRTPEQQQALLAQMRTQGSQIRERIATARDSFENRTPSRLYTTPAGAAIAAPTNMYGQPIADFQQRYAQREERMADRGRSSVATLGAMGFGAMQNQQASMVPPPIRNQSLFGGMGYAATLGGPQPASSMVAAGPMEDRTRRRIFGAV
jgi:hypothetical protein